jgi:hypothetical protein
MVVPLQWQVCTENFRISKERSDKSSILWASLVQTFNSCKRAMSNEKLSGSNGHRQGLSTVAIRIGSKP